MKLEDAITYMNYAGGRHFSPGQNRMINDAIDLINDVLGQTIQFKEELRASGVIRRKQ